MLRAVVFYLVMINVIGFIMVAVDKYRSIKKKWRIKENDFFIVALMGGSVGVYVALRMFHHKTKHRYFMWGIPAILILQVTMFFLVRKNW